MVILPSNRQETAAVATTANDPRCAAIAQRYGSVENLYLQVANGMPAADTPSMVMCMKTYGQEHIIRQLASRMKMAVMRMGETTMDDVDAELVARGLADDPGARTLGYDLVMDFFNRLERCEYELYACKPRNVLAAWQTYSRNAHMLQDKMKQEAESVRRDAEWEEHRRQCITLAEFKRRQQSIT